MRTVRGRLRIGWQNANASLWFIPALLVAGAIALSVVLLYVDAMIGGGLADRWWLFGGHAEGARAILSAIASSLITVVSVAFSITTIAMQQGSSQFTPRILRNFTSDRGNQVVLGTYIATFVYSLLVLRQVRTTTESEPAFIPTISITAAVLLALVSLGLLIYFIHHTSQSLQVPHLLASIRLELDSEIDRLFPAGFGAGSQDAPEFEALVEHATTEAGGRESVVRAEAEGYLRHIDAEELTAAFAGPLAFAAVVVRIGEYVPKGTALVRCWWTAEPHAAPVAAIRSAFHVARQRSIEQDPLFGIRQIADIAIKALSPGINDPTTAEESLEHLGAVMGTLIERELPSPLRMLGDGRCALLNLPCFREYLDESFAQIRRAARSHVHVTLSLLRVLAAVAARAPMRERAAAVADHARDVVASLAPESMTPGEISRIRAAAREVMVAAVVHAPPEGSHPMRH